MAGDKILKFLPSHKEIFDASIVLAAYVKTLEKFPSIWLHARDGVTHVLIFSQRRDDSRDFETHSQTANQICRINIVTKWERLISIFESSSKLPMCLLAS